MTRRSTIALSLVVLSVGFAAGLTFDSWSIASRVKANAISQAEADELSRELDADNALVAGSKLLAKVARLTTPSVVHIQSDHVTRGSRIEETGSGVLVEVSKSGVCVVTNRHVILDSQLENISIHLQDGRVIHPTKIWTDEGTDVAVLAIDAPSLQPAQWGDSDQLDIGNIVLAMGSPFGLSQSVTYGIISAKGRRSLRLGPGGAVLNQEFLQTDAAINPGNSGGPLIDLRGRVIGINTAIASSSGGNEGIGFSIPCNLVRRVAEQLVDHGQVQRAYLGVRLDPDFNMQSARQLGLDRVRGGRVLEVYSRTPASQANLKVDDVVLSFDGVDVQDHDHLINLVSLTPVGKQVRLLVWHEGKAVTIQLLLADRSDLKAAQ